MSTNVYATPSEVRNLAKELLRGTKELLGESEAMSRALQAMSQTFQDDGLAEYSDTVYRIEQKLKGLVENELDTTVKSLTEFASLLEQAQRA